MKNTSHGFVALRLEGGILPAEFFQKVANLSAKGQKPGDYRLSKGLSIKDEIGRAWRSAVGEWQNYQERRVKEGVDQQEIGVRRWLVRLLKEVLQFEDIEAIKGHTNLGSRAFPLTHRACGGTVPMVLTTCDNLLDKGAPRFGEDGKRRSPHGLVQEFLNADESSLWGIVANGTSLRLLRDNPSMTRPAYLEVNLERIFEEELYADFAAFWLILHSSRFTSPDDAPEHCPLELWRAEAHEVGERALASMRDGVTQALRELGSGFLAFPGNDELRASLRDGGLSSMAYYQQLLRLVYRMIFLYTMEERDLLHAPRASTAARTLYREGYGISRLRELSLKRRNFNQYPDLWEGLQVTFRGLADGAEPLGLPSLGGLFTADQCSSLDSAGITNDNLLKAVHALGFFPTGTVLARINYHDMDTEELGSVYESLLELHPEIRTDATPWRFAFAGDDQEGTIGGSVRKLSGSYYTPDSLVQELIKSALEPVIAKTVAENPADPAAALLKLKVIDPASGSGHFLLAAARRLAAELAKLEADTGQPDEALYRQCMRTVVRHCIHGVDLNPMAVELCRMALWLETIEPGMPLGFLDSHIRCGNSLIGVRDLAVLKDGIPDEAYKPLTGDEKEIAASLKKDNKAGKKGQKSLFSVATAPKIVGSQKFEELPEESLADIRRKREEFDKARLALDKERLACDLWTGAFFAPKTAALRQNVPTSEDVDAALAGSRLPSAKVDANYAIATEQRFFHWPLEFPGVFAKGGFDVVLGNPPWEIVQARDSNVDEQKLAYEKNWFSCGIYSLLSGRRDLYKLFLTATPRILHPEGKCGFVLPIGFMFEDDCVELRKFLFNQGSVISILHVQNAQKQFFSEVHASYRFLALTYSRNCTYPHKFSIAVKSPAQLRSTPWYEVPRSELDNVLGEERSAILFNDIGQAKLHRKIATNIRLLSLLNYRVIAEFHASSDKQMLNGVRAFDSDWTLLKNGSFHLFCPSFGPTEKFVAEEFVEDRLTRKGLDSGTWMSLPRLVFRDIARNDDSRTLISCLVPPGFVSTYDAPMVVPVDQDHQTLQALFFYTGYLSSFVADFLIRPFVDKHIKGYVLARVPIPRYDTSSSLMKRATDISKILVENSWERLNAVKCPTASERTNPDRLELEAIFIKLAGLNRDEAHTLFDSFGSIQGEEIRQYGEYRTRRLVLEAWDRMERQ